MILKNHILLLAVFLMSTFMFGQDTLTGKDLHLWVTDTSNGLHKITENESYRWEFQYLPLEYMIAKVAKNSVLTENEYIEIKAMNEGAHHLLIKVQSKAKGNVFIGSPLEAEETDRTLDYFLYDFEQDLLWVEGNDTIVASMYHLERNYGALDHNNILVSFKRKDAGTDQILLFQDRIFGMGIQEIVFRKEDIDKTPKLITKI